MKTIVLYHRSDYDGIFCREIARKFIPDAELIGWEYGDTEPAVPKEARLYMLDISVAGLMGHPGLIWIDHHKSAMEKWDLDLPHTDAEAWCVSGDLAKRAALPPTNLQLKCGKVIPGFRIDGVAACRLAWQWFSGFYFGPGSTKHEILLFRLPAKEDFIERKVSEPLAVRLAGEYDIWDRRDPDAELFQHGLRSRDLTNDWPWLLQLNNRISISELDALIDVGHRNLVRPDGTSPNPVVLGLLDAGKGIQYAQTHQNESIIKELGFTFNWEGLTWLGCNAARYNSLLFNAGLKPEHDACFGFKWTGKDWSVSLYHAPGKEHLDLSLIAVKNGGGGHAGACGFRTQTTPWIS